MTIPSHPTHEPDGDRRSDAELLQTAAGGSEAFTIFYRRNVERIMAYFWVRTRDHPVTADLTAETFAIALEQVKKFDPLRGNGAQWLHGIAANLLKKYWRRHRVSVRAQQRLQISAAELSESAVRELEAVNARLDAGRVRTALERVPAKNREAVHLRIVEELEYTQIASRLDCKLSTAKMRVQRGLRRLESEFNQPTSRDDAS